MGDNWKMGSGSTCWRKPGKRKASWMEQQGQKSNHLWTLEASSCSHLSNRQNGIKSCSRVRIWFIMSKQTSKTNSMIYIIIIRSAGLVEPKKSWLVGCRIHLHDDYSCSWMTEKLSGIQPGRCASLLFFFSCPDWPFPILSCGNAEKPEWLYVTALNFLKLLWAERAAAQSFHLASLSNCSLHSPLSLHFFLPSILLTQQQEI